MISGKIPLSNFCVPFDFDGDRFLFLDYLTKDKRKICIFYTISKKDMYEYKIEKDFGHISHMKIFYKEDNKIFLCRNNNECEIHLIDENFTCIESWKHIGNDNISSFVYIKESKITEEYKIKIKSKRNQKKKINDCGNFLVENDSKRIILKKNKSNIKNNRNKNINLEQVQGESTILNININSGLSSNNYKNIKILNNTENIEKTPKNKNRQTLLNKYDNEIRGESNFSNRQLKKEKTDGIDIYNRNKFYEENRSDLYKKNEYHIFIKDKIMKPSIIKNNKDSQNTFDIEKENYCRNTYYIITLDKNGNVNLYNNRKVQNIFNLYEIDNVDEKYKKVELFSVGFPYYIIMNELYIAISTDHGLFVISNSLDE